MKILIDNGHGMETPGKCSPDGLFREYAYTREIAARIVSRLVMLGYDAELLVPESRDVPLRTRCRRANMICNAMGKENVLLVSVHVNAASSDGQWHNASGWSAYTTEGVTSADLLAFDLYESAKKYLKGQKIRMFNGSDEPDFEAGFYILKHTSCAAVLTENMFQDCAADVAFLLSEKGKEALVKLHVEGILRYILNT